MRIPADRTVLGGLGVSPREVPIKAWQAHVLKHPFGLGALYNLPGAKGRRWDSEGWSSVDPVVLSEAERAEVVPAVRALEAGGARCRADRLERTEYHGEAPYAEVPCYECPKPLAEACGQVTAAVGSRYAGWAQRVIDRLADGEVVPHAAAANLLMRVGVRSSSELPVAVLSTGWLPNRRDRGARINTSDGIRVDLYYRGSALQWRTTYRVPPRSLNDRVTFLLDVLRPVRRMPLSESVLVPRQWWQRYAQ